MLLSFLKLDIFFKNEALGRFIHRCKKYFGFSGGNQFAGEKSSSHGQTLHVEKMRSRGTVQD